MKLRILRLALLLFGIAIAGPGRAQDVSRRAQPVRPEMNVLPAQPVGPSAIERSGMSAIPVDPNRRLAVGDVVTYQIQEDRDPPVTQRVTATGDLNIVPFGRIRVAGKTTSQVESDMKAFLEKDYYYIATVMVSLDSINPTAVVSKITVSGEVRGPGAFEFAAGESITLSEAIMKAGNFTQWAKKDKVHLYRGGTEKGIYDVRKILSEGRVQDDPILRDGDRIHVDKNWFNIKGD